MSLSGAAGWAAWTQPSAGWLQREGLCRAVNLGAAVPGDRVNRRAGQRLVGREQPAKRLGFVEAAVEQQGQRARQALDDLVAVNEGGRYRRLAVRTGDRQELAVAEELLDTPGGNAEPAGNI